MARWFVTLLVIALAVTQVTARTVPSDAGLDDQKNVVTFGGLGGYSGIGSNGLQISGISGGVGPVSGVISIPGVHVGLGSGPGGLARIRGKIGVGVGIGGGNGGVRPLP